MTPELADAVRPMFMLGLPCHDDPCLLGFDLNGPIFMPPTTHGRPPIDAFPQWYAGQFSHYILDSE